MRVGGRTSVGAGGGGRARTVTVTTPQAKGFEEIDGIGCALFVFEINGNSVTSCRLAASPKVLIDDGGSMPEGVEQLRSLLEKTLRERSVRSCLGD